MLFDKTLKIMFSIRIIFTTIDNITIPLKDLVKTLNMENLHDVLERKENQNFNIPDTLETENANERIQNCFLFIPLIKLDKTCNHFVIDEETNKIQQTADEQEIDPSINKSFSLITNFEFNKHQENIESEMSTIIKHSVENENKTLNIENRRDKFVIPKNSKTSDCFLYVAISIGNWYLSNQKAWTYIEDFYKFFSNPNNQNRTTIVFEEAMKKLIGLSISFSISTENIQNILNRIEPEYSFLNLKTQVPEKINVLLKFFFVEEDVNFSVSIMYDNKKIEALTNKKPQELVEDETYNLKQTTPADNYNLTDISLQPSETERLSQDIDSSKREIANSQQSPDPLNDKMSPKRLITAICVSAGAILIFIILLIWHLKRPKKKIVEVNRFDMVLVY
ncbi:hypothetical protein CDIK_1774 [Cucumispora dikerogammari]|nr:hypothetical protein CDIK_1774 [Cucumispora dikerogammari]